jgi:hypothetical protein
MSYHKGPSHAITMPSLIGRKQEMSIPGLRIYSLILVLIQSRRLLCPESRLKLTSKSANEIEQPKRATTGAIKMSLKPALLPALLHFDNSLITIGQLTFITYLNSHYCQSPTHTSITHTHEPLSCLKTRINSTKHEHFAYRGRAGLGRQPRRWPPSCSTPRTVTSTFTSWS